MSDQFGPVNARSLLFVPGDRPDRFDKAVATGADCVIIDLEDAVAPASKESALTSALTWLLDGGTAVVRINGVGTPWHADEVAALAGAGAVIMVPKSQSADDLARITERLGPDRVIALVETALGVRDVDAVCAAPGVVRVGLGNVDLSAELGVDPASHAALAYACGRLVVGSAAAGIAAPIDGVTTALDSIDLLTADLAMARELGFGGKLCIHPQQVAVVNSALQPTEEEVVWARRVVDAGGESSGVTVIDGRMVDAPVVARAEQILRQVELGQGQRRSQSRPTGA